jgi:DNA uptake protein ComE-like DNA-binding protein
MIKNFIRDFFSYSGRERNGIIFLLTIILLIIAAYLLLPFIIINQEFNIEKYKSKIRDFELSLEPLNKQKSNDTKNNEDKNNCEKPGLFRFNPNKAGINDLKMLGFNQQVIDNLIKYRYKGGYFYKKADLLKIYGMDTSLFYRLIPFIELNNDNQKKINPKENNDSQFNKHYPPLNINKANADLIREILGADSLLSERIVKYRNLLGGFANKKQLDEIYGFNINKYNLIINNLFIDTTLILKMNINKSDEQTLVRHPYLNKYYARAIIKYRNFTGEIRNINELSVNNILPENIFFKIKPYLSVK